MSTHSYSSEQIIELGARQYREKLEATLLREHPGKFVAIDIDSGDYEVADEDWQATRRLRERRPGCMTYGVRIGSDVAYEFPQRHRRDAEQ